MRPSRGSGKTIFVFVILTAIVVAVAVGAVFLSSRSSLNADDVAAAAGAQSCMASGFSITYRIDHSTATIWDCSMPSGMEKCVTYQNNIASDSTAMVRLLFATALSQSRPACLS